MDKGEYGWFRGAIERVAQSHNREALIEGLKNLEADDKNDMLSIEYYPVTRAIGMAGQPYFPQVAALVALLDPGEEP